jgi:hypothetical protein
MAMEFGICGPDVCSSSEAVIARSTDWVMTELRKHAGYPDFPEALERNMGR